ncbi:hypothetical protein [Xylanimonas allomyrinae]|uniref:hypothetical protein n=1 Tax=Xylanimonas allomyrinae TaxID=2509459 RepID=UPI001B882F9B|nr:hypothetical protein [Xylanimonas allomyrinae]
MIRATDDEGAASSGTLAVALVGVVVLLFVATIPLLSGIDQSARGRTMAESAALAGAESIRTDLLTTLDDVRQGWLVGDSDVHQHWQPDGIFALSGYGAASSYAARNDGELPADWYRFDVGHGIVDVRARLTEAAPSGGHTESTARARLGVDPTSCRFRADRTVTWVTPPPPSPTPTPTPTPTETSTPTPSPTPTETPEPPPPYAVYSPWVFSFGCEGTPTVSGGDFTEVRDDAIDLLRDAARPRLID